MIITALRLTSFRGHRAPLNKSQALWLAFKAVSTPDLVGPLIHLSLHLLIHCAPSQLRWPSFPEHGWHLPALKIFLLFFLLHLYTNFTCWNSTYNPEVFSDSLRQWYARTGLYASFSNWTFWHFSLVAWSRPWWEYLQHRNWQTWQIRFSSPRDPLTKYLLVHHCQ